MKKMLIGVIAASIVLGGATFVTAGQSNNVFDFEYIQPYMKEMHPNFSLKKQYAMFEECHKENSFMHRNHYMYRNGFMKGNQNRGIMNSFERRILMMGGNGFGGFMGYGISWWIIELIAIGVIVYFTTRLAIKHEQKPEDK
ncbi:hypothetical protein [Oceanobacillus halophilus]|uniref:Uncharacterized protein n=1 Tax=Oceanobacillus halophilus TaxID=930130 RepID=A0A494ZRQ9_9BACI|nr:hypothetical protein [Oceanobacillus halophilus]RKQ28439.1 hypothetical protein D8M06_18875 [Oceanobacillus halophilus]